MPNMTKMTVIRADNNVIVDNESLSVDCGDLPSYIHAIQWDGEKGWIEYAPDARGMQHPNIKIVDITPFQYFMDRHELKKIEQVREAKEREVAQEAARQSLLAEVEARNAPAAKAMSQTAAAKPTARKRKVR